ncbi:ESC4 [Candida pseudojiufengensis]|uniref:ESC4 n=1 Tax=Candida pseudojiufengensis TaxID=497109 RepID=UPI0022247B07|nr:ESC4 [Candida pseudojiufengensis]KAI5960665.1 ESC4 [Candida pseudojiufengensis]
MFQGSTFLIIKSLDLSDELAEDIKIKLKTYYATKIYIKDEFDNSKNYMNPPIITHIITSSLEFIEYQQARKSMIPIITPNWLYNSLQEKRQLSIKSFNPDPSYFFKNCFICCADNLPPGDKELIYAGIKAFGGNYLDILSKYTTHLITSDMTNEKAVIASTIIVDKDSKDPITNLKLVLPHWIDHCITMGKKLDEEKYLLPESDSFDLSNNEMYFGDLSIDFKKDELLLKDSIPSDIASSSTNQIDFFKNKKIHISKDFNLSQRLNNSIKYLIEKHGGIIVSQFNEDEIDIYLGKYRSGEAYFKSRLNKRIIIGNLQWFYSILVTKNWTLPLNSNILYYPIPSSPIESFKNLKISITNYSGDSRSYLSKLITLMGGNFTKTLTRENHYLICGKPEGKKYEAALNKWVDSNNNPEVQIVNHFWLEDCFIKWEKLNDKDEKYRNFSKIEDLGLEPLVGRVTLDDEDLDLTENLSNETGNIDDSMSEDEATQSKNKHILSSIKNEDKDDQFLNEQEKQPASSSPSVDEVISIMSPINGTPNKTDITEDIISPKTPKNNDNNNKDLFTLPNSISRYGGRSAAKKAAAKLHDNMTDLNNYLEISKSKQKMKNYMEQLDQSNINKKRKSDEDEETTKVKEETLSKDQIKRPKTDECDIIAIMTGCESEIELTKTQTMKLQSMGIKIITDLSKNIPNTLIAPKILRTEKFLRSLSKVSKIIHPNYLIDILDNFENNNILHQFNIDDYSLDKINLTTNKELGIRHISTILNNSNKGKIFSQISLNLSENLNGGIDVISTILKDHGLKNYKEIKSNSSNFKKSQFISSPNDEKIILIANKKKDHKLITSFKNSIQNGIILNWDWCVKSIFSMKLKEFKEFEI